MPKELSVGTIMTDGNHILACQPYARKPKPRNFDLPKGHWEEGESMLDTAIREMKEETGFEIVHKNEMVDLGRFSYIPTKDLHLFFYGIDALPEPDTLECESYFTYKNEKVPEVIAYKHVSIEELHWFFPSLQKVLSEAFDRFAALED